MPMKRLILFAHFDRDNRIQPYVQVHLQALKALGGRIHFISNSALAESELAKLAGLVDDIRLRDNQGLDFGMWKEALAGVDLAAFEELVLTNSSVLGPATPLAPIFQRMEATPCDFWGMTESTEGCRHLQTFFLVFRKAALAAPAFKTFWDSVLPFRSRQNIIFSCELGLTRFLVEQGLVCAVAFPLEQAPNPFWDHLVFRRSLSRRFRPHRNPTHHYPDLLLQQGMPYGKLSALSHTPQGLRLSRLLLWFRQAGFQLPPS